MAFSLWSDPTFLGFSPEEQRVVVRALREGLGPQAGLLHGLLTPSNEEDEGRLKAMWATPVGQPQDESHGVIDDSLRGLQDAFASFGIGPGGGPGAGDVFGTGMSLPRLVGNVGGQLGAFALALPIAGGAAALTKAGPVLAQLLKFGLTSGGLEAARELGTTGTVSPAKIVGETAVGTAMGAPVGRLAAGGLAAGVGALTAPLTEATLPVITAQTLAALILGNPRVLGATPKARTHLEALEEAAKLRAEPAEAAILAARAKAAQAGAKAFTPEELKTALESPSLPPTEAAVLQDALAVATNGEVIAPPGPSIPKPPSPTMDLAVDPRLAALLTRADELSKTPLPTFKAQMAGSLAKTIAADIRDLETQMSGLTAKGVAIPTNLQAMFDGKVARLEEALHGATPIAFPTEAAARDAIEAMVKDMNAAELRRLGDNPPLELQDWHPMLRSAVGERMLALDPLSKQMDEIVKEAEKAQAPVAAAPALASGTTSRAQRYGLEASALPEGKGYVLSFGGHSMEFPNQAQLQQFLTAMDDYAGKAGKGTAPARLALDAIGAKRGFKITLIGEDQYMLDDLITGQRSVYESLDDIGKLVKTADGREALIRDIGPQGPAGPDIGPTGFSDGDRPYIPNGIMPATQGLVAYFRPQRGIMQGIQDATGIKTYDDIFVPIERGAMSQNAWQAPYEDALKEVYKGISPRRYHAVQDYLISPTPDTAKALGITAAEKAAAAAQRRWYGAFFKDLGFDAEATDSFIKIALPAARKHGGDIESAYPHGVMPRVVSHFLESIRDGHVRLENSGGPAVAEELLHSAGRAKFLNGPFAQAKLMLDSLDAMGPTATKVQRDTAGRIRMYLDGVLGAPTFAQATSFINTAMTPFRRLGVTPGDFSEHDVERFVGSSMRWGYGTAMAGRAALVTRNFFASLMAVPYVGFKMGFRGIKKAMTTEGMEEVRRLGLWRSPALFGADAPTLAGVTPLSAPGKATALVLSKAQKAMDVGMSPYVMVDHWTRGASYHQGKEAILEWAPKLLTKALSPAEFKSKVGLDQFGPTAQNRVMRHLIGKPVPDVAAAAQEYGVHISENVNWMYSASNAPAAFRGVSGRVFGMFGTWPMNFAEYILKGVASGQGKVKFAARFMALYAATRAAGAVAGVDMSSALWANPLSFEGGSIWGFLKNTANLLGSDRDRKKAISQLKRFVRSGIAPYGAALWDIQQALEEDDGYKALALLLGFSPTK